VAYVTANLAEHPVSYLMNGVFEAHDDERFETIAVALQPAEESPAGRRAAAAFSRLVDVSGHSDAEAAALLRELEVDIAVDLMGYTKEARPGIFAHRAAPVQVNYLGYPGTMGAPFMDYIIADRVVIPDGQHHGYSEQVIRLPGCLLPNDRQRQLGVRPTRAQAGLPGSGIALCAFAKAYKIAPPMWELWMRLLRGAPQAFLWLGDMGSASALNLEREAQARGIAARQLVFAARMTTTTEHLGRLALADLCLDTVPYNGHSTTCDALWAGVPVMTCAAGSFAGRVAASALGAAGLPELVAATLPDYERRALELIHTPERLAELKQRLLSSRLDTPLFDTTRYCRQLEAAYLRMWQLAVRGEPPRGFDVEPGASDD
jgi:predicted O-linked N-acetylglucosamine transferase (SPINDLY family)